MTSNLPPLLALQAFEVAARHCSFTQAAKELNLTQSAVSHRIKQLEKFLDYELFTRLPRSLVLNDIGKAYLPSVKKTFRELSISTNSVFGNKTRKTINIRAPLPHAVLWLTPILDEFLITYPNVSVRVISELWAHDPQQFKSDFELRLGYGSWDGYAAELIQHEIIVPFYSVNTQKIIGEISSLEILAQQPRVMTMGYDDLWQKYFSGLENFPDNNSNLVWVDTTLAAIEMVIAGNRSGLIYKRLLHTETLKNKVVQNLNMEMELDEAIYLCTPRGSAQLEPESEVLKTLLVNKLMQTYP